MLFALRTIILRSTSCNHSVILDLIIIISVMKVASPVITQNVRIWNTVSLLIPDLLYFDNTGSGHSTGTRKSTLLTPLQGNEKVWFCIIFGEDIYSHTLPLLEGT
jgi:hypothetical protein